MENELWDDLTAMEQALDKLQKTKSAIVIVTGDGDAEVEEVLEAQAKEVDRCIDSVRARIREMRGLPALLRQ
jgi:hypothetical protein